MRNLFIILVAIAASLIAASPALAAPSATVAILVRVCDDADGDGICAGDDNCPDAHNPDQQDNDWDGLGDACDGDDDNDGYSDNLEETMGTDPLDSMSQPGATALYLLPEYMVLNVGSASQVSVFGIFEPALGDPIDYDMSCVVEYRELPSDVVAVDSCGNVVGQVEGATSIWAEQIIDGTPVAVSNTAEVAVDGSSPYVDALETHPYDSQGMNEDANGNGILDPGEDLDGDGVLDVDIGPTPRVPIDSGIVIRVVDAPIGNNIGIDSASIQMLVNGTEVPVKIRDIILSDAHELDIAYRNFVSFEFNEVVIVELSLADVAGNSLYYTESFQVESRGENRQARRRMPVQTTTDLGDGTCEVAVTPVKDRIDDEFLEGARIIYQCSEPIAPRFGPVDEIPPLDIATPVGIPMNLEPANVFDYPVELIIPIPGAVVQDTNGDEIPDSGLENYQIYQYTSEPTVLWRDVLDVPGWMVEGSRQNLYDTAPPAISAQVNHFSGVQAGSVCLAPVADFSWSPAQAEVGEGVQFQDESFGTVDGWAWDFGDGTISTEQNPLHTYDQAGDYTVTLTVDGPCGNDTKLDYLTLGLCEDIHLLDPVDSSLLSGPPTFTWLAGCSNRFQLEISRRRNFKNKFVSPVLSTPSFTVDPNTWSSLLTGKRLYWRVMGWDESMPSNIQTSVEVWGFIKTN